jgi:predicted PurR-regulated permease PerM
MPYPGEARAPVNERPLTRRKIPGWPIAAALAVLFLYFYYVRVVLLPFVLAGALGFILTPLVEKLHRVIARGPRWLAATAVYILFLVAIAALGYWLIPALAEDVTEIAREAPKTLQDVLGYIAPGGKLMIIGAPMNTDSLTQGILERARAYLLSGAGLALASGAIATIFGGFLTLVLLAYFLISGPAVRRGLIWLVPPEYRDQLHQMTRGVTPMLRRYFVGLLIVVTYTTTMSLIFFGAIFRISHAPFLSILVGVLELVPVFGPMLSMSLVIFAAFQEATIGLTIGLIVFVVVLRLSIDQIVGPLVLGQAAYVHPIVVIFAFLTGAVFLGVLGLLLAVPVAATIKIVLTHYYSEKPRSG